jgi:hypothetical protein
MGVEAQMMRLFPMDPATIPSVCESCGKGGFIWLVPMIRKAICRPCVDSVDGQVSELERVLKPIRELVR